MALACGVAVTDESQRFRHVTRPETAPDLFPFQLKNMLGKWKVAATVVTASNRAAAEVRRRRRGVRFIDCARAAPRTSAQHAHSDQTRLSSSRHTDDFDGDEPLDLEELYACLPKRLREMHGRCTHEIKRDAREIRGRYTGDAYEINKRGGGGVWRRTWP